MGAALLAPRSRPFRRLGAGRVVRSALIEAVLAAAERSRALAEAELVWPGISWRRDLLPSFARCQHQAPREWRLVSPHHQLRWWHGQGQIGPPQAGSAVNFELPCIEIVLQLRRHHALERGRSADRSGWPENRPSRPTPAAPGRAGMSRPVARLAAPLHPTRTRPDCAGQGGQAQAGDNPPASLLSADSGAAWEQGLGEQHRSRAVRACGVSHRAGTPQGRGPSRCAARSTCVVLVERECR